MTIDFTVVGEPRSQGSKMCYCRGGKGTLVDGKGDTPKRLKAWRKLVADAAAEAWDGRPLLDSPVSVAMQFHLLRPKSTPKWKRWHGVKPDADKLARAVGDSLTKTILFDDSRIAQLLVTKQYVDEDPGVSVLICVLPDDRPAKILS